jgi:hypothetical protein
MANWTKWTPEMDAFLLENYEWIGDTHLAVMFQEKFPKTYGWTKKHIEKRRKYKGLKRTAEQRHILQCLNNADGRHEKMWDTRGRVKEGEIKHWDGRVFIKVSGEMVDYYRHIVGAKSGEVARKYEGELRIIDKKENQRLNAMARANRNPELKSTIKALNTLKKLLYGKEDRRFKRDAV